MWAYDIDSAGYRRPPGRHRGGHPRATHRRPRTAGGLTRILAIETSCDETAAAVVDDGRHVRSSVVSQPDRPPRPLRRRGARGRRPGPRRAARRRWSPRPWPRPDATGVGHRRGGGHHRPRPDRLAAGRGQRGQGLRPGLGRAVRRGQPPRGPPARRVPGGPRPGAAGRGAAGVRRPHPARAPWTGTGAATGCWARPSTTPPARRSTRWPASSASATPAVRPSTGWPPTATRRPSPSPGPARVRATTSPSAG